MVALSSSENEFVEVKQLMNGERDYLRQNRRGGDAVRGGIGCLRWRFVGRRRVDEDWGTKRRGVDARRAARMDDEEALR